MRMIFKILIFRTSLRKAKLASWRRGRRRQAADRFLLKFFTTPPING